MWEREIGGEKVDDQHTPLSHVTDIGRKRGQVYSGATNAGFTSFGLLVSVRSVTLQDLTLTSGSSSQAGEMGEAPDPHHSADLQ